MISQPARTDEAETPAGSPGHAQRELQVVVGLFEDQFVAGDVFVQVALTAINTPIPARKRLPKLPAPVAQNPQCRLATNVLVVQCNFVLRFVRKESRIGVSSPGGHPAVAGHKEPVVFAADHADEKGRHLIHVANLVIDLAQQFHEIACGRVSLLLQRRLTNIACSVLTVTIHGRFLLAPILITFGWRWRD